MQRLQRFKQPVGELRHFARMRKLHSIAARHLFHHAALIAIQHGELAAHAARSQVGDNAVAHAGGRVVHGGMLKQFEGPRNTAAFRHDQFCALAGPKPWIFSPIGEIERTHLRDRTCESAERRPSAGPLHRGASGLRD